VGLQRDELEISVAGGSARRHASEGQVRTAAIALRAAEAALLARDTGAPPVVLVDDTFGELDPARRRALVSLLPAGVPLFATLTDAAWAMEELPGARCVRLPLE
jgi:DNA replication and repair protein RecF